MTRYPQVPPAQARPPTTIKPARARPSSASVLRARRTWPAPLRAGLIAELGDGPAGWCRAKCAGMVGACQSPADPERVPNRRAAGRRPSTRARPTRRSVRPARPDGPFAVRSSEARQRTAAASRRRCPGPIPRLRRGPAPLRPTDSDSCRKVQPPERPCGEFPGEELAGIAAHVRRLRKQHPDTEWRVQQALRMGADRLSAAAGDRLGSHEDLDATNDTETSDLFNGQPAPRCAGCGTTEGPVIRRALRAGLAPRYGFACDACADQPSSGTRQGG